MGGTIRSDLWLYAWRIPPGTLKFLKLEVDPRRWREPYAQEIVYGRGRRKDFPGGNLMANLEIMALAI